MTDAKRIFPPRNAVMEAVILLVPNVSRLVLYRAPDTGGSFSLVDYTPKMNGALDVFLWPPIRYHPRETRGSALPASPLKSRCFLVPFLAPSSFSRSDRGSASFALSPDPDHVHIQNISAYMEKYAMCRILIVCESDSI